MYVCMYLFMCIYMCISIFAYIYIHIHIYIVPIYFIKLLAAFGLFKKGSCAVRGL